MKLIRLWMLMAVVCVMLAAQTTHLGQRVFYNDEGVINLAVDAGLAMERIDGDYVPFVLYMGTDKGAATVPRENVFLIHNDTTYTLPELKDFRSEYSGDRMDNRQYTTVFMGRESLIMTRFRDYRFDWEDDFFPARGSGRLAVSQAGISNIIGFKTFAYFKNPGFKQGDQILIKVIDNKNADIWGACAVKLE
jgi:hypothetical protein